MTETFLNWRELSMSILQGLMITAGVLFMYQYTVGQNGSEEQTRTSVFITLIIANVFLTLVNRSFYYSFITTLRYKNNLLMGIILLTLMIMVTMIYVDPVTTFFHLTTPHWTVILQCTAVAAVSVFWFEIVKWRNRSAKHSSYEYTGA